jgi:hypothetical protein
MLLSLLQLLFACYKKQILKVLDSKKQKNKSQKATACATMMMTCQ